MTQKKHQLIYVPAPTVSKEFRDEFNRLVPVCPGDPTQRMLRYVWGCDRLEQRRNIVGTTPRRRYVDWDGKYLGRPVWVLEGWQNPEVYTKADWEKNQHILGDYPRNGVWDFIEYHQDADEKPLQLDHTAIDRVRSWAFWKGKGNKRSIEKLLHDQEMRDLMEVEAQRAAARKVAEEFGEEWVKAEENLTNPAYSLPSNFKKTESGLIIPN